MISVVRCAEISRKFAWISASVWELLLLLAVAVVFATVYRVYFSRAVALTQVCEKIAAMQNSEVSDTSDRLRGDATSLSERARACENENRRRTQHSPIMCCGAR